MKRLNLKIVKKGLLLLPLLCTLVSCTKGDEITKQVLTQEELTIEFQKTYNSVEFDRLTSSLFAFVEKLNINNFKENGLEFDSWNKLEEWVRDNIKKTHYSNFVEYENELKTINSIAYQLKQEHKAVFENEKNQKLFEKFIKSESSKQGAKKGIQKNFTKCADTYKGCVKEANENAAVTSAIASAVFFVSRLGAVAVIAVAIAEHAIEVKACEATFNKCVAEVNKDPKG